jgi:uncharacterized coiled-coil DUF342 family protein
MSDLEDALAHTAALKAEIERLRALCNEQNAQTHRAIDEIERLRDERDALNKECAERAQRVDELVAALRDILDYWNAGDIGTSNRKMCEIARAAITKVKGGK